MSEAPEGPNGRVVVVHGRMLAPQSGFFRRLADGSQVVGRHIN